ncbi:hypothetical protein D3Z38_06430 [Clostridiales bacterium]|nr:hypothetical protein [Clostridiales bacterium]
MEFQYHQVRVFGRSYKYPRFWPYPFAADPDAVARSTIDAFRKKKHFKIAAVYYQAMYTDGRRLLWMVDWFQDMTQDLEANVKE